jgi:hypothetical protein
MKEDTWTLIFCALKEKRNLIEIIRMLIAAGADVNAVST